MYDWGDIGMGDIEEGKGVFTGGGTRHQTLCTKDMTAAYTWHVQFAQASDLAIRCNTLRIYT
jgi:hypothetical protein